MELAKVTSKGQVTLPIAIRNLLGLREGSKVVFFEKDNEIVIRNSAMIALEKIQSAFEGEAERLGLRTEDDVVNMIKDFRKEKRNES